MADSDPNTNSYELPAEFIWSPLSHGSEQLQLRPPAQRPPADPRHWLALDMTQKSPCDTRAASWWT